jgi:uncharacterized protein
VNKLINFLIKIIHSKPWLIIIIAVVLTAAVVPGLMLLKTDSSINTLVSPDSTVFKATQLYEAQFGSDPITVIVKGDLQEILATANIKRIAQFEEDFSRTHDCYITSPLTLLNVAIQKAIQSQQDITLQIVQAKQQAAQAARQQVISAGGSLELQNQAAAQAEAQVMLQFQSALAALQQIGTPSLENANFIAAAVFNQDGTINPSFASLIPDNKHILLIVKPTGTNQLLQMSRDIQTYFKTNPLPNAETTVVSSALVTQGISESMQKDLLLLLSLAIVVMIAVLFLLFRVRWRLLSLIIVALGAVWTFGLMGYIPIHITMVTMAVLPVLIGLGIDYPIQFHNRYQEELTRSGSVKEALANSIKTMLPAVGIALLATVVGFATLYVSRVPMIRDFGVILVIGVILCYLAALFLLYSLVFLSDRKVPMAKLSHGSTHAGNRIERFLAALTKKSLKYPVVVCSIALILGLAGIASDHWLPVNTDYQRLIPQNMPALQDVHGLNDLLGNSGQITFMVEAENVTDRSFLKQMQDFEKKEMELHAELISLNSPRTLISSSANGSIPTQDQIDQILASTPSQFTRAVIASDHRMASLTFGIKYITLDQVNNLLNQIEQESKTLNGIQVTAVGSTALSAAIIDSVVGGRFFMDGLCLIAIFIILLLVYRRLARSLFIMISIGIVIGWSTLAMFAVGVPLNPLTAVLGVITTAIGTEFMVLLSSRYEEERASGVTPREAMLIAVSKMGRAVLTTGITTLGGFAVLIASNFTLVRDFGVATVIGIFLCLVSTLIVLPNLLVFWDERRAAKLKR